MRAIVGGDYVQGDTRVGDFEWRIDGGGVCDTDFLPGGDWDRDGGAWWWNRRWLGDAAGDAGVGRGDVGIPAEAAGGVDVCDFVVGGDGVGGMQLVAAGGEWSDACGDVSFVVDDDV